MPESSASIQILPTSCKLNGKDIFTLEINMVLVLHYGQSIYFFTISWSPPTSKILAMQSHFADD